MDTLQTDGQKRKRGRPRIENTLVFYRGQGGRVKAFNPAVGANVNAPARIPEAARLYDGLGFDWVNWGKPLTRDGDYNAARRTPFRKPEDLPGDPVDTAELDKAFAEADGSTEFKRVLTTISGLFDGHIPDRPVVLNGTYWLRFLAGVFIREAGADGISRSHFARPDGKVWASVNLLPSGGAGYNYTEEAWYGVVNMIRPPVFCVRVVGNTYLADSESSEVVDWTPDRLARCVLASLWRTKAVDSCAALSPAPETAPLAAVPAPEDPAACANEATGTPPVSGDPDAVSGEEPAAPELEKLPFPMIGKTWGEIKAGEVWLKGLTTAKDLQAPAPLSRVLDTVVSHAVTKTLTDACRAIGDKKARNEYKRDNLHVWYPAPVYADRFKGAVKENIAGYTGLACLDFDGLESFEAAENVRDDLFMEFREVLFSAVSASGLGVYVLVALDFDGTEAGYRTALSAAFETFEAKGYMPDTGCVDPTRARYMSSDPDALSRPDAYVPPAIKAGGPGEGYFILPASMLRSCWTNSGRKRKGAGKEYLKEALDRIANAPEGMKDTTITSVMGTAARLIRNYGLNADEVYDRVRAQAAAFGYDTKKTESKIRRLGVANGEATDAGQR